MNRAQAGRLGHLKAEEKLRAISTRKSREARERYELNPIHCRTCGESIPYEKRLTNKVFCDHSCAVYTHKKEKEMKFNPLSTLMAFYWGGVGAFCGVMTIRAYGRGEHEIASLVGTFTLFLLYGAVRFLMREKPYTWKRARPFRLFMTEEERRNDS